MLRGVRFCSSLHLLSDPNWRHAEACAKDNKGMIPYGKCLVNYAYSDLVGVSIFFPDGVI